MSISANDIIMCHWANTIAVPACQWILKTCRHISHLVGRCYQPRPRTTYSMHRNRDSGLKTTNRKSFLKRRNFWMLYFHLHDAMAAPKLRHQLRFHPRLRISTPTCRISTFIRKLESYTRTPTKVVAMLPPALIYIYIYIYNRAYHV